MRRILLAALCAVACSPTPPPKPPPQASPKLVAKPAPPPTPAKTYALSMPWQRKHLKLDAHRVLWFGHYGGRALAVDGVATAVASSWTTDAIEGAIVIDGKFRFVDRRGAVYEADEPLGNLRRLHVGIRARVTAAGKSALFAVGEDGMLKRFGGNVWETVTLPFVGSVADLKMNARGEGMIALAPAAFLRTDDDGATWKLDAPAKVGERLGFKGESVVRLAGNEKSNENEPAYSDVDHGHYAAHRGTRVWSFRGGPLKTELLEVDVAKGRAPRTLRVFEGCASPMLQVAGSVFEVLCHGGVDFTVDGQSAWKLFRSEDDGKTFKDDGRLLDYEDRKVALFLSPDGGTVMVKGTCPIGVAPCDGRGSVRPASETQFSIYQVNEGKLPSFYTVDFGKNGEVYALGTIDVSVDAGSGRLSEFRLFRSSDRGKTFTTEKLPERPDPPMPPPVNGHHPYLKRRKVIIERRRARDASIALDANGKLAAVSFDDRVGWVVLRRQGDAWVEAKTPPSGRVSFAGLHGLLRAQTGALYETADAGDSWSHVAFAPTEGTTSCNEDGCMIGPALRHGWGEAAQSSPENAQPSVNGAQTMVVCKTPKWSKVDLAGGLLPPDKKTIVDQTTHSLGVYPYVRAVETEDHAIRARYVERTAKGIVWKELALLPARATAQNAIIYVGPRGLSVQRNPGKTGKADVVAIDAELGRIVRTSVDGGAMQGANVIFQNDGLSVVSADGKKETFVTVAGKQTTLPRLDGYGWLVPTKKAAVQLQWHDQQLTTVAQQKLTIELWPSPLIPEGSSLRVIRATPYVGSSLGFLLDLPDVPDRAIRIDVDPDGSMKPPKWVPSIPLAACADGKDPSVDFSAKLAVRIGDPPFWLATGRALGRLGSAGICATTLGIGYREEMAYHGNLTLDPKLGIRGLLMRDRANDKDSEEAALLDCSFEPAKEVPAALQRTLN